MLRYINSIVLQGLPRARHRWLKCFILLHFGEFLQCGRDFVVQCTKNRLTGGVGLPRMNLLRRTIRCAAWGRWPRPIKELSP
ncbi:MAG: hypothetical protein ACXWHC_04520 [Usitatibacter sp.]